MSRMGGDNWQLKIESWKLKVENGKWKTLLSTKHSKGHKIETSSQRITAPDEAIRWLLCLSWLPSSPSWWKGFLCASVSLCEKWFYWVLHMAVQNEDRQLKMENWKLKMKNIVVHKTLERAQNENLQSADNCAGRSYPLTAMSFFINFMFFMVKKWFCTRAVQNELNRCPKWGLV